MRTRIPKHLRARFTELSSSNSELLVQSLSRHYFDRPIWGRLKLSTQEWLATEAGREDIKDHVDRRLRTCRSTIIPWLDAAKPLSRARILEIGCGTGVSTVALAEQGANVTALDIDRPSLLVAEERCALHGVSCEFVQANGTEARTFLAREPFDYVIFFACLEHMTIAERIVAMRDTWAGLPNGAMWVLIETPNRLWFFDDHTSRLPFFNWLPDDLAFAYSKFSPREPFRNSYRSISPEEMASFLRHGRGLSFHEFDLAIGNAAGLDVVSSLQLWLKRPGPFGMGTASRWFKRQARLQRALSSFRPDIHPGFFHPYLDLIIRRTD